MMLENVYKFTQWGGGEEAWTIPLYQTIVPAKMLADKADIYRRLPERKKGYQRELSDARLGKGKMGITGYLLNQMGIFPTSVLINVRKQQAEIEFTSREKIAENIEIGKLEVPNRRTWWIVDGQHRIEGLKIAAREDDGFYKFPVSVTITNEDIFTEMMIFHMVNSRAKSVKTDLSYRILQRMLYSIEAPKWIEKELMSGANRRKAIAATVVDYLNTKSQSPLKGRIQEIGEQKKPEHVAKDGQFTRYVSYILKEGIFGEMLDERFADLLISYWKAIKELYPNCFEKADDYLLFGTIGLSSLSRLFPIIYGYCSSDGDVSTENMKYYLSFLQERTPDIDDPDFNRLIDESWWHKGDGPGIIHGTGEGHYEMVTKKFAEKISSMLKDKGKNKI